MLTLEELEAKVKDVNDKVTQSIANCNQAEQTLNQMRANHNALIGAQMFANDVLEAAKNVAVEVANE